MGNCWSSPPAAVAAAAVTGSDSSTTAAAAADSSATAAAAADSSTAPTKPNSGSNFSGTSNTGSNDGQGLSGMSSSTGNSLFSAGAAIGSLYGRSGEILAAANLKTYSFRELEEVTMNFSKETILGKGGFGSVYVGWVDEETLATTKIGTGMNVAIKRLNHSTSGQGLQEWRSEVHFLGRISHPNLVKLLGYCLEDQELLLVYEFMPKGSLDRHLFNRNSASEPLSWERRMKIAMDAARGLAFLHTSEKVIYRDFKAANILLDDNYNAKISDFGLARLGPAGEDSFVSTRIMGTRGYVAPEYMKTGHLYVKSDVYGFGAVLLELLTGLRAVDDKRPSGQRKLMDVVASHRANLKCIMDERMEGQYSSKAALIVARLALRCLDSNHKSRPSMKEVLETLENCSR